jgi:hypothetical protein
MAKELLKSAIIELVEKCVKRGLKYINLLNEI